MNYHANADGSDGRDLHEQWHITPNDRVAFGSEKDAMIVAHLPLVQQIAKRIHARVPEQVDLCDLVSAGTLGLIDACNKYNPTKQVPFDAYASFRIRGAIIDSLRSLDWSPRNLRRKAREMEQAISDLNRQLGCAPSEDEIARAMNMSLSDYQHVLGALKGLEIGSLQTERSDEENEQEELAYVPDSSDTGPLFRCMENEMKQRIARAIDALPQRERVAVTLYYYEEMTQQEIGLVLNVSHSRVSQMLTSATLRMRSGLAVWGRYES